MALTKRAKYLLYICIHFSVGMLTALLLDSYGIRIFEGNGLYLMFLLVTPIAVAGYLTIIKFIDVYKQWQYRHGRDVYREETYEDDAGFIHINQSAAQINKDE